MNNYTIIPTNIVETTVDWDATTWKQAETAEIAYFYPHSSDHHPVTRVRLVYTPSGIHGIFHVQDQFVRCIHTGYQEVVWQDACVEFFVKPKPTAGYFNFEMNCGGALLCFYITDATPSADGFVEYLRVPLEDGKLVQIRTTLPAIVEPEVTKPLTWTLQFFIPFALLEKYVGPLGDLPGQEWRANFNKCAENNSHPHWATWNPLPEPEFHLPDYFGRIQFV